VDIDLIGTFHVMRAAFPHLTKPGASVINITAPQSFIPMRYQANVCAAKAGVDQMTRVMALKWAGDCIRVNSISPGPIAGTEGAKRLSLPGSEEKAIESIPLKRVRRTTSRGWRCSWPRRSRPTFPAQLFPATEAARSKASSR